MENTEHNLAFGEICRLGFASANDFQACSHHLKSFQPGRLAPSWCVVYGVTHLEVVVLSLRLGLRRDLVFHDGRGLNVQRGFEPLS